MAENVTQIKIKGFKSIRELDLKLSNINILVGSNGSGKSNFISFFKLLNKITNNDLEFYTTQYGADYFLFCGGKETELISFEIIFGKNKYVCELAPRLGANKPPLFFKSEKSIYIKDQGEESIHLNSNNTAETKLPDYAKQLNHEGQKRASSYVYDALKSWRLFHFHDTSDDARVKKDCDINDNQSLRPFAENLAAFLYKLKLNHNDHYRSIVDHVRLVAPFFKDFDFNPNGDTVSLIWKEKYSDDYRDALYLSDGTLRFICLATLLLQPSPPSTIVIDEPELGLHPHAIEILASMIRQAARNRQVIISTQSVQLIDKFSPEDIIVVDRKDKESVFRRLSSNDLKGWLDEYSLGELWQKNLFGANP